MMATPTPRVLSGLETSALLAIIEQAGLAVLTLVENLSQDELQRSRLTRVAVHSQLITLSNSLANLAPTLQANMPELGWDGWNGLQAALQGPPGPTLDDALWFACGSLVPATVLWLRVYRKDKPALFRMTA